MKKASPFPNSVTEICPVWQSIERADEKGGSANAQQKIVSPSKQKRQTTQKAELTERLSVYVRKDIVTGIVYCEVSRAGVRICVDDRQTGQVLRADGIGQEDRGWIGHALNLTNRGSNQQQNKIKGGTRRNGGKSLTILHHPAILGGQEHHLK